MIHNTLYEKLGIERTASEKDILLAFQKKIDHYGESVPPGTLTAYRILFDGEKRKLYDWVLDQYHSGFPVDVPEDRYTAFRQCCYDFGFDLTPHPTKRDAYELSVLARRPPGLDSLPVNPPEQQTVHSSPPHESHDRDAAPPPPPTTRSESSDPEPVSWWPPPPLVLGSRIYHWACFNVRVQHVVRTPRAAELHVININNNQPMVINSPRLVHFRVSQGDYVNIFGLAEMSIEQFWYFTSAVNKTQPSWIMLDGWEDTIPWPQAVTHFGIRRKRSELYDLIKQYLTATIELALRDLGASGAQLIALRDKAVDQRLKTQFRLPWFNLPT